MGFETLLADVAADRKRLVVYAPDTTGQDLAERLATRNLVVEHRRLPALSADAFVVVRDGEGFHGALSLADLLDFLTPPIRHPRERGSRAQAYRTLYDVLDEAVFVSLDRRQLLAASRELEDRAWRTATGRLHAGFQRTDAFEAQATLYRNLAATTDIDVHVYLPVETTVDRPESLTVHTEPAELIANYWFLLYDDGATGAQNCGLVAKSAGERRYRGFWTYDAELVEQGFDALS